MTQAEAQDLIDSGHRIVLHVWGEGPYTATLSATRLGLAYRKELLVLGSPDDRLVPRSALARAARWYGGAPLMFPGMGHDLMLDSRWAEPLDAILDWLEKGAVPEGA